MKEIPGGWPNSWWRRGSSPDESTPSVERLIQSFSYKQPQDIKKSSFFFKNLSQATRTSPRPPHRPEPRAWKRRTCTGNHHRQCQVGECRASGCDGRACTRGRKRWRLWEWKEGREWFKGFGEKRYMDVATRGAAAVTAAGAMATAIFPARLSFKKAEMRMK